MTPVSNRFKIHVPNRIIIYFLIIVLGASGFFFTLFLPAPQGFYAFIATVGLAGFAVVWNIFDTKKQGKQLVCPTGSDCNAVINSQYSKFFGISLEYLGMAYFAFITLTYFLLIVKPGFYNISAMAALVLLSISAGLFSAYLLFVQAFLLRQWCIWCILTAMISLTIFVVSLVSAEVVVSFLARIENILQLIKFTGFALGMGGTTAATLLFFHFIEDASIDQKELNIIKGLSELIWFGFGLILVSQFAVYIAYPELLSQSGGFITQMIALIVFAVAGAVLMIIYTPFLVYMPFEKVDPSHSRATFASLRLPTALIGVTAISAWYFAFVVNFLFNASLFVLLSVFIGIILTTFVLAILWDRSIHTREVSN